MEGKGELEEALAVTEVNARADALVEVVREFPKTLAGRRARKLLAILVEQRQTELGLRNMPDLPFGVRSGDVGPRVTTLLCGEERDPDAIEGFYDLDDPDVAEALLSPFFGRRAWAAERLQGEGSTGAHRVLVHLAKEDEAEEVRGMAVESLRAHAGKAGIAEAVQKAFEDPASSIRRAACAAARAVLGEMAAAPLRRLTEKDPDPFVRKRAEEALAE